MTPTESRNLIASVGGDAAFARLLGLDEREGVTQRVNNWKRRGIPAAVVLAHYETFQRLMAEAKKASPPRKRTASTSRPAA